MGKQHLSRDDRIFMRGKLQGTRENMDMVAMVLMDKCGWHVQEETADSRDTQSIAYLYACLEKMAEQEGVARLRELAEADKDGRLVVLPCKMGDTVYWVHGAVITECKVYRVQKNRKGLYICLKSKMSHGAFRTDLCFGKSIFLTREEAEKVLEARNETGHYLQGRV
jgi:hypothetical protein